MSVGFGVGSGLQFWSALVSCTNDSYKTASGRCLLRGISITRALMEPRSCQHQDETIPLMPRANLSPPQGHRWVPLGFLWNQNQLPRPYLQHLLGPRIENLGHDSVPRSSCPRATDGSIPEQRRWAVEREGEEQAGVGGRVPTADTPPPKQRTTSRMASDNGNFYHTVLEATSPKSRCHGMLRAEALREHPSCLFRLWGLQVPLAMDAFVQSLPLLSHDFSPVISFSVS